MGNPTSNVFSALRKFSAFFPAFAFLVYIIGFVVINSYLLTYNFFDENLLSTNYLKAGILLSLLLFPLFARIFKNFSNPTDNLLIAIREWPGILLDMVCYGMWFSLILIPPYHDVKVLPLMICLNLIAVHMIILFYASSALATRMKAFSKILALVLLFIIPIIVVGYLGWHYSHYAYLFGIIVCSGIVFTLLLGHYGDKTLSMKDVAFALIAMVFAASFFGKYVYGYVPRGYGGGKPSEATILFNAKGLEWARQLELRPGGTSNQIPTKIVYAGNDRYLLQLGQATVVLDKTLIDGFVLSKPAAVDSQHGKTKTDVVSPDPSSK